MKKKDMIDILDKVINGKLYQDYLLTDEDLNDILDAILAAGMLPPSYTVRAQFGGKDAPFVETKTYYIDGIADWEDEDGDTKI